MLSDKLCRAWCVYIYSVYVCVCVCVCVLCCFALSQIIYLYQVKHLEEQCCVDVLIEELVGKLDELRLGDRTFIHIIF